MTTPITFEDSIKLRLKSIVADLIPEERWDGIVKATVHDFERNDLPALVKRELTDQYKKLIAEEFKKPEWQAKFNNSNIECSLAMRQIIIDAAPQILASMMSGSAHMLAQDIRAYMSNGRGF